MLGIGAAWNEEESRGLGLFFPPTAERFERLEETLQICLQMWCGRREAVRGQALPARPHAQRRRRPLTRPHPPILIGGGGEKKTLRLVAQYADACNLFAGPELQHKLDVLREHCERVGRDYDEIEKTAAELRPRPGRRERRRVLERLRELPTWVSRSPTAGSSGAAVGPHARPR